MTVRIVAAEDDGGSGASFAKGRVGGGAIGIYSVVVGDSLAVLRSDRAREEEEYKGEMA